MEFKGKIKGRIEVKSIRSYAYHGVHAFERQKGAWFITDVILDTQWYGRPEKLQDTLNYEEVVALVQKQMEQPRDLIETVCADVLEELSTRFGRFCSRISVKVSKPEVPIPLVGATSCMMYWEPGD